ncbi:MAG: carbohydrate kinase family protein [Terriglobia bacterium]
MTASKRFDVTVVGELNLDLILYGLPAELAPERELLASGQTLTLGSSSAILAHNLAVLGSRVGFISRIGDDPLGQLSVDRLAAGGVDVSRVRKAGGSISTGLTVILHHSGFRNILTYPGTMFEMNFEDLDIEFLADSLHFHLSSFFLHRALQPRMRELFATMKARGLTTSLDVNDDPEDRWDSGVWDVLPYVDIFFLNAREIEKLTGKPDLDSGVARLAAAVPHVVVKLGAGGALIAHCDGTLRRAAAPANVVDVVGAGDSFDAGFLHQFVRGASLDLCLDFANLTGAFSTTRPGGTEAFRDPKALADFLERNWRSGVAQ